MGANSLVKRATEVVRKSLGGETDPRDQDLLDTLKTEHDEVKGLLEELQVATGSPRRKSLVRQIKSALVPIEARRPTAMRAISGKKSATPGAMPRNTSPTTIEWP
jgi:hypothetical protein